MSVSIDGARSTQTVGEKLAADCLAIVQLHTVGDISFSVALVRLTSTIGAVPLEEDEVELTLTTYIDMLRQHERRRDDAERRAGGGAAGDAPGAQAATGGQVDHAAGAPAPKSKRARTGEEGASDEEPDAVDDDAIDDLLRTRKVPRSALPWAQREQITLALLPPSVIETRNLLSIYSDDPKRVLANLLATPGRPDVPVGVWTAILAGRAVNLDDVLVSVNAIEQDARQVHDLGDFQLSIGHAPVASKAVRTAADWQTAWDRASEAVLHAFPHRAAELTNYARHVRQLFSALAVAHHDRVINFDRARGERNDP
jgi:hypothetical protein